MRGFLIPHTGPHHAFFSTIFPSIDAACHLLAVVGWHLSLVFDTGSLNECKCPIIKLIFGYLATYWEAALYHIPYYRVVHPLESAHTAFPPHSPPLLTPSSRHTHPPLATPAQHPLCLTFKHILVLVHVGPHLGICVDFRIQILILNKRNI